MKPDIPATAAEAQLVTEAQAGSMEAFEQLVLQYEGRVYAFLLQRCRSPEDAQELAQDTFVKAYQAIDQFDSTKPFGPWIFTIARRKCIDRFRSAKVEAPAARPEEADLDTPSELLSRADEQRQLWRAAKELLSENQFEALWLRYVEDMEVRQIAGVMQKTRTHVKILLFRARKALARHMKETRPHPQLAPKETLPAPTQLQRTPL